MARLGPRVRRAALLGGLTGLLALASGCATLKSAYDVVEEAAIPAVTGGVVAATGAGPVAVVFSVVAADLGTQAIEGDQLQAEFREAIIEEVKANAKGEVVEKLRDLTAGEAALRWWRWLVAAGLLAWLLKSPSAMAVSVRAWVKTKREGGPRDRDPPSEGF